MSDADKKQLNDKQDFEITSEMENRMQARLDAVEQPDEADLEGVPRLEKKKDEEEEVRDEEKEIKDDEVEDDEVEDDITDDEDNEVKDDEVKDGEVKDDKEKEYVLPENYYQAMRHVGWSPEQIKEVFERDPEQALKDFKFYHDSQNYVTQRTSDLGRAHLVQTQRTVKEVTEKKEKSEYKGVDLKAFEEQFGEENPAAVAILKSMNDANKLLFDEVQSLKQEKVQQQGPTDEQQAIWNEIDAYFNSADLKGFDKFYGVVEKDKEWNQCLTGTQWQNRMSAIEQADAYYAGMELQGKKVSYTDALQRAHLLATASIQESIIRDELHTKIKKRSKGITVKSSGRKATDDTSKKKDTSEKGLIARTKKRIKAVTGKMPET